MGIASKATFLFLGSFMAILVFAMPNANATLITFDGLATGDSIHIQDAELGSTKLHLLYGSDYPDWDSWRTNLFDSDDKDYYGWLDGDGILLGGFKTQWMDSVERKREAPVPEPATMLLFGTGLAGLAGLRLRKKNK